LQFLWEHYAPKLIKAWLHIFLDHYRDTVHICRSLPQEDIRLVISLEYLERNIQTMKNLVQKKFSSLCLIWMKSDPRIGTIESLRKYKGSESSYNNFFSLNS
jgi:hypothetical protein